MLEIHWVKFGANIDTCEMGMYLLMRKHVFEITTYEIWYNEELEYTTGNEYEFLQMAQPILMKRGFMR